MKKYMRKTKRRRNPRKTKKRGGAGGEEGENEGNSNVHKVEPVISRPVSIAYTDDIDLMFVRHGFSCANARKKKKPGYGLGIGADFYDIPDPSLTPNGIEVAIKRGKEFCRKVNMSFPGQIPIICSSTLLRAQLTAYLMMQPELKKPSQIMETPPIINIIPYVSETGFVKTADNTPRSFEAQETLVKDIPIDRRSYVTRPYTQNEPYEENEPDFNKFRIFLKDSIGTLIQQNIVERMFKLIKRSDKHLLPAQPIRPLVIIFTHGHFIEEILKKTGVKFKNIQESLEQKGVHTVKDKKDARPNYSAWQFTFNTKTAELSPVENAVYLYNPDVFNDIDVVTECSKDNIDQICGPSTCDSNTDVIFKDDKQKTKTKAFDDTLVTSLKVAIQTALWYNNANVYQNRGRRRETQWEIQAPDPGRYGNV